jgi:hypothetical protein
MGGADSARIAMDRGVKVPVDRRRKAVARSPKAEIGSITAGRTCAREDRAMPKVARKPDRRGIVECRPCNEARSLGRKLTTASVARIRASNDCRRCSRAVMIAVPPPKVHAPGKGSALPA